MDDDLLGQAIENTWSGEIVANDQTSAADDLASQRIWVWRDGRMLIRESGEWRPATVTEEAEIRNMDETEVRAERENR